MALSTRQKRILTDANRDLSFWKSQTPQPGDSRDRLIRIDDARHGFVKLDTASWLDMVITSSQSTMNSRSLIVLERLGLIERKNFNDELRTTHVRVTEKGKQLARQLVSEQNEATKQS